MNSNKSTISIAIVDDHSLVRTGLKLILKQYEDVNVTVEASHGQEFIDALNDNHVDIVLLDLEMPVMDGKEVLKHLTEKYPKVQTIILTMHQHDSFIANMMELGANGYLLKESKPEEVIEAIRTVKKDGIFFNPMTSKALLGKVIGDKSSEQPWNAHHTETLNQRELDVLKLICAEHTTNEIADKLFLSPKTIEGYRKKLLEKTGSKNVVGLVKYAIKYKLV